MLLDKLNELSGVVRQNAAILPNDAYSSLRRIDDVLRPILSGHYTPSAEQETFLDMLVDDWVPDLITPYVALPDNLRAQGEKNLVDSCMLLEGRAADCANQIIKGLTHELSVMHNYLNRERY